MKRGILVVFSVCIMAAAAFGEVAEMACVRDPFWPVGYKTEGAQVEKAPVKVEKIDLPVSEEEWAQAREAIPRPSGIFVGRHPKTEQSVDKMILLGRTVYAGDQFCTTNKFVAFTWQVDSISFNQSRFELSPISAERLKESRK